MLILYLSHRFWWNQLEGHRYPDYFLFSHHHRFLLCLEFLFFSSLFQKVEAQLRSHLPPPWDFVSLLRPKSFVPFPVRPLDCTGIQDPHVSYCGNMGKVFALSPSLSLWALVFCNSETRIRTPISQRPLLGGNEIVYGELLCQLNLDKQTKRVIISTMAYLALRCMAVTGQRICLLHWSEKSWEQGPTGFLIFVAPTGLCTHQHVGAWLCDAARPFCLREANVHHSVCHSIQSYPPKTPNTFACFYAAKDDVSKEKGSHFPPDKCPRDQSLKSK